MAPRPPASFLEAIFKSNKSVNRLPDTTTWVDHSTSARFIFKSSNGVVSLQKRSAYPATFAYIKGHKLVFGYGKYDCKSFSQLSNYNDDYGMTPQEEYLWCEADLMQGMVTIDRDIYCTVPLFASSSKDRLVLSNNYDRVCELSDSNQPRANELGLIDILLSINTREFTWREDVYILLERQHATWRKGEFSTEPRIDIPYSQLQIERRADPLKFKQYLENTLDFYWQRYAQKNKTAFELSCGIDSTIAPGYFATLGHEPTTTTILFPGNFAVTQQAKLRDFLERFNIKTAHTTLLDIERHYPLAELARDWSWKPFAMYGSMYGEAHREQADTLWLQGVETVFTGIGGDEMCANAMPRRRPIEQAIQKGLKTAPSFFTPQFYAFCMGVGERNRQTIPSAIQVLPLCTVQTAENRNNVYLDRGIWPVTPFSDPRLYRYSQGLPVGYRTNKNILRAYQHALKFPMSIYNAMHNEHFGDFFTEAVVKKLEDTLRHFLERSVLEHRGLLDTQKLLDSFHAVKRGICPDPDKIVFEIYKVLVTEINLQTGRLHLPPVRHLNNL